MALRPWANTQILPPAIFPKYAVRGCEITRPVSNGVRSLMMIVAEEYYVLERFLPKPFV